MKGKIPPELLQKIREAVNLVEVVGEHVVLRKSGSNHSGLCPFHSERTPSFSVSEGKQVYHCYGCKRGGDLFRFFMDIHGVSFPEAIEELAERGRVALPQSWSDDGGSGSDDPETQKRRAEAREKLALAAKLNRFVAAYYHHALGQPAQAGVAEYFRSRGVDPAGDLGRSFYVGSAPASWDALASHLIAKKAPLPLAVELGLIRPSTKADAKGPGYFDLFRNRAMFPILDMRGRVAGFGGRDLGSDGPKYMNSPESLMFQKSKLAFGFFQAQKHIREKDELILVEGYFDVLALHAAGFQNAVAACGTSLTPDHLSTFRRFASRVIVLFDGDRAGVSAMERAMETGLDHGMILHGAAMPEGLDPDEVLFDQRTGRATDGGRERMEGILAGARPLLDARVDDEIRAAAGGPEARTQALKKIGGWLARFADPVGREVRQQHVQEKLGVSEALLRHAMGNARPPAQAARRPQPQNTQPQSTRQRNAVIPRAPAPSGAPPQRANPVAPQRGAAAGGPRRLTRSERTLLSGLVRGGEFVSILYEMRDRLPPGTTVADLFDYLPAREFLRPLIEDMRSDGTLSLAPEVLSEGSLDPQVRSTLTEAIMLAGDAHDGDVSSNDFQIAAYQRASRVWARFSQRIKSALAEAEAKKDAELQAKLMKEYLDVQRKMKEFNRFYDEA